MPAVGGIAPTRSEIVGWDTAHLYRAAADWTSTARHWEESFDSVHRGVMSPGGTVWEGDAADAAYERTFRDLVRVRGLADALQAAAGIASRGADRLDYLKSRAVRAIELAEEAGFTVGEDLSVTDRTRLWPSTVLAVRQAQAVELAADIRAAAVSLSAADMEIATNITTAVEPLSGVAFEEAPAGGHVQLVDYRSFKEGPPIPDPGSPDQPATDRAPNETYPGRDARGRFIPGNTGGADGAAAAEQRLQQYEKDFNTSVVRQQIRVAVIDPSSGQPMTDPQTGMPLYRYYDALEPTGKPGQYVGIEVKSGTADLTRQQKIFDSRVSAQTPATGTLNGQPVKVIDTELLRTPRFIPGEGIPRSVVEPLPEARAPSLRGGLPVGGAVFPDDAMPHFVDVPGHLAGAPDVPVLGDGLPDHDR